MENKLYSLNINQKAVLYTNCILNSVLGESAVNLTQVPELSIVKKEAVIINSPTSNNKHDPKTEATDKKV